MTCIRFPEHGKCPQEHDTIATGHDNRLHEHGICILVYGHGKCILEHTTSLHGHDTCIIGHGKCPIEQGTCPPWYGKDFRDMIYVSLDMVKVVCTCIWYS
jgi:hypothetical protein